MTNSHHRLGQCPPPLQVTCQQHTAGGVLGAPIVSAVPASLLGGGVVDEAGGSQPAELGGPPGEVKYFILPFLPTMPRVALGAAAAAAATAPAAQSSTEDGVKLSRHTSSLVLSSPWLRCRCCASRRSHAAARLQ
jgi:hypothetical protein